LSRDEEIREAEPIHVQGFFKKPKDMSEDDFERNLYVLRKKTTNKIYKELGSEE
jgi:glutamate synthase domain-containing protein 1